MIKKIILTIWIVSLLVFAIGIPVLCFAENFTILLLTRILISINVLAHMFILALFTGAFIRHGGK